jgi:thiamine-monophosphate kinase
VERAGPAKARGAAFTEEELLATLRKLLSGEREGVLVGVGDDAAVVEAGRPGAVQVLTTDMLVEGIHFDRPLISPRDLGAKAVAVNVSDIAAMGASPRFALVALALSTDVEPAWVVDLYGGMLSAADEYALSIVGGDLSRGEDVVIAVTVVGEVAEGRAVRRSGAVPGDRIVVTGALGGAAGGLLLSRAPAHRVAGAFGSDWGRELLRAHARPVARVGEGESLAQAGATAMIDLSDGLALDLSRLCAESGVGARVDLAAVPVAPELDLLRSVLSVDPLELALSGGEDYELLATIGPQAVEPAARTVKERFGVTLSDVGEIIERGLFAVDADGRERPLEPKGWDHFERR